MIQLATSAPGGWQSRMTFVLALAASAVGLGNLWRFSFLAGEHGGGAFVLFYLACLFLVAVPVLIAEVVLGSYGRGSPVAALRHAADRSLRSRSWTLVAWLTCLTALLILSYYCVVAGWALAFARGMQLGDFAAASTVNVARYFEALLADGLAMLYWQSLFLLLVVAVAACGVRRGLGLLVWLTVPALIALLGVLVKFALDNGNLEATQEFLFSAQLLDFSALSLLVALGHALYTLGIGVATGLSYGSYAPERLPIGRSVMAVAVFDTLIALAAGLAIFPIVFAHNIEPSMGPGLMFLSLPYAFGNMLEGEMFGTLFFSLVVLAALGSAVALLEPVVAVLQQQFRLRRVTAVLLAGAVCWLLGLLVVRSLTTDGGELLATLDFIAGSILLPLGALLTAVFVGWRMRRPILRSQLYRDDELFFSLWHLLLRYIAPPAIALVLFAAIVLH